MLNYDTRPVKKLLLSFYLKMAAALVVCVSVCRDGVEGRWREMDGAKL